MEKFNIFKTNPKRQLKKGFNKHINELIEVLRSNGAIGKIEVETKSNKIGFWFDGFKHISENNVGKVQISFKVIKNECDGTILDIKGWESIHILREIMYGYDHIKKISLFCNAAFLTSNWIEANKIERSLNNIAEWLIEKHEKGEL